MLFIKTREEFLLEKYETFNIVAESRHKILYKAENLYFLLEEVRTDNVWDLSFGYLSNEALKFFYDSDFNEHFSFESTNEQLPFTITNLMCKILKDFFNNHSNVIVEIYGIFDAGETVIKDTSKRTRMYWRSIQREFDTSEYNLELDGNTIIIGDKVEDLVLTEAILPRYLRNKNLIYHSTSLVSFKRIMIENKIIESTYDIGVATSRNKDYIFGGGGGSTSNYDDYFPIFTRRTNAFGGGSTSNYDDVKSFKGRGEIQLILDKTKISYNYKIKPYDWEEWKLSNDSDLIQSEDKIYKTLENVDKYIVGIHINKNIEKTVKFLNSWKLFKIKQEQYNYVVFDNNWNIIPKADNGELVYLSVKPKLVVIDKSKYVKKLLSYIRFKEKPNNTIIKNCLKNIDPNDITEMIQKCGLEENGNMLDLILNYTGKSINDDQFKDVLNDFILDKNGNRLNNGENAIKMFINKGYNTARLIKFINKSNISETIKQKFLNITIS